MERKTWAVFKKIGDSWVSDGLLYRSNENLSLSKTSTQSRVQLADGSKAFVTSPILYINESLVFHWDNEDGTMKTKVEEYITNQNDLKLIDQNNEEYVGRFISLESTLLVGLSPDTYVLQATFERMSSSSSSSFSSSSSSSSAGV